MKLQLLLLVLCVFFLPVQLQKKHEEHGREDKRVKPGEKPGHRPEHKPGEKPEHRPEHKPGEKPEHRPEHKPGEKPEHRPEHKPGEKPEHKPEHNPGEKPEHKPGEKPGHRPGEKPGHRPEERRHEHDKKRRRRVQDLLADYDDSDDSRDDDDEGRGEWLFELQDVKGSCTPNPCLNNGECEERRGGKFRCKCPKNFRGRRCEQVCGCMKADHGTRNKQKNQ